MPTYLYRCPGCSREKEIKHGMNEEAPEHETCCNYCYDIYKKVISSGYSGMSSKFFEGNTWEDTKYRRY